MHNPPSLFATKLRAWRASHGTHGRMTQEELADLLGVSLDAVSKYERSLSFIRGDLEHRLTERLCWTTDDVIACREDWEIRRPRPETSAYRLVTQEEVTAAFDGSTRAVNMALAGLEGAGFSDLPEGFSVSDSVWEPIVEDGAYIGIYVMHGVDLIGHIALTFLGPELETRFRERKLVEGEFTIEMLKRPILPGRYFAYCAAVYIARGHEAATRLLLSGFVDVLEELAAREVFISNLGAIGANPVGRQLCQDLGFQPIGPHVQHDGIGFWVLPGEAIAGSLLGRRSARLQQLYAHQFSAGTQNVR